MEEQYYIRPEDMVITKDHIGKVSLAKRLFVYKMRFLNVFSIYRKHFAGACSGRRDEYRRARKEILKHPYWFFQTCPPIVQDGPVNKMIYSMNNGPHWRYDAMHDAQYLASIQEIDRTYEEEKKAVQSSRKSSPVPKEEIQRLIAQQKEKQRIANEQKQAVRTH